MLICHHLSRWVRISYNLSQQFKQLNIKFTFLKEFHLVLNPFDSRDGGPYRSGVTRGISRSWKLRYNLAALVIGLIP